MGIIKREPIERFREKYVVDSKTGCWIWIASLNNKGYGNFRVDDKIVKAHRFSYEYYNGPLDNNLEICHNCANRRCVNYEHLRQDTSSSNTLDMTFTKTLNTQKLTVEQVIEIKKELLNSYYGQVSDLARKYNVLPANISHIKRGRSWAHISIP